MPENEQEVNILVPVSKLRSTFFLELQAYLES